MNLLEFLRSLISQSSVWPLIDNELLEAKKMGVLKGTVLNAGAGTRQVSHLIEGVLVNQDIAWPGEVRTNIHIYSPIHQIPKPACFFDAILCIAVLEHVENPEEILSEFFRVLKPGGHVVASVPFLQPEHKAPTDFQRYTSDGLARLFAQHGFDVFL
jgi:SAM-dependent methyltransferase